MTETTSSPITAAILSPFTVTTYNWFENKKPPALALLALGANKTIIKLGPYPITSTYLFVHKNIDLII